MGYNKLNPLEKEVFIKLYKRNPDVNTVPGWGTKLGWCKKMQFLLYCLSKRCNFSFLSFRIDAFTQVGA
jgi:hypothetical protein